VEHGGGITESAELGWGRHVGGGLWQGYLHGLLGIGVSLCYMRAVQWLIH
jgi:hypothetical protein